VVLVGRAGLFLGVSGGLSHAVRPQRADLDWTGPGGGWPVGPLGMVGIWVKGVGRGRGARK
jgi:hypothetical protein